MSILSARCPCCGSGISFEESLSEYICPSCGSKLITAALNREKAVSSEQKPEPPEQKIEPPRQEAELTEAEKAHQLERKAAFKKELHETVKHIDELRERREVYKSQLKTTKQLSIIGIALALIAAAVLLFPSKDDEKGIFAFAVAGVIAVVALFMLIASALRKKDVHKQQKKLEATIREKKDKRDVLIGRLNKINKQLHIHSDE